MLVQIWSYNYAPEPQGIAPLSEMLARGLAERDHDVSVVAAHPHYPEPVWGIRLRPYRERRAGIEVIRLPIWPGRRSAAVRIRQELSFLSSLSVAAPLLFAPDVVIAVTPSFPALAPAVAFSRARRTPLVMWVQDIVTDGAASTRQLKDGMLAQLARRFEKATYDAATKIVVISDAFRKNLLAKGVPGEKIERIFNPSTRATDRPNDLHALAAEPSRILAMGNIGHSQGLAGIVDAFQASDTLSEMGVRLVIAGSGVASEDVRARITSDRVSMPGVLYGDDLSPELGSASLGLVSQRPDISEFNLPSKMMNYMAYGIPIVASVDPSRETARIVRESGAGWVTDAADPTAFANLATRVLRDREALAAAGAAGSTFAREHFTPASVASRFEAVIESAVQATARSGAAPRRHVVSGSNPSRAKRKSLWRHSPRAP